jgi:hypothetical protein
MRTKEQKKKYEIINSKVSYVNSLQGVGHYLHLELANYEDDLNSKATEGVLLLDGILGAYYRRPTPTDKNSYITLYADYAKPPLITYYGSKKQYLKILNILSIWHKIHSSKK